MISNSYALQSRPTQRQGKILLVDDDPGLLRLLSIRLGAEGYSVEAVESAETALDTLPRFRPDLVITDLRMEHMDGIGLLKEIQRQWPGLCVMLLTAHGTIPDAVEATQSGAFGFLTKPVDKQQLLDGVRSAMKLSGLSRTHDEWNADIVTRSHVMQECLQRARRVAASNAHVLISGEAGTGKELLAHAIHRASPRKASPLIIISCGAVTEELLESELFDDAVEPSRPARRSRLRGTPGGTLLLNEIGDMPARLQTRLLRAMKEEETHPVASSATTVRDTRVMSTTRQRLDDLVEQGEFREDLYHRLNVVNIQVPPLSQRREDIPLLVEHFLERLAQETDLGRKVYAPEALELLVASSWPGNVRQLRAVVRQNASLSPARVITAEQVRSSLGEQANVLPSFSEARDEFTRNYLSQLLQITGGNVSHAARLAKRNRTDFYKLLARYQLIPDQFKEPSKAPAGPSPFRF